MPKLAQHLNVVCHTFVQPFCLKRLANLAEILLPVGKVLLNFGNGTLGALFGGHEEVGRVYPVVIESGYACACHAVNLLNAVNVVIPEGDAQHMVAVGKAYLYGITLDTEVTARKVDVVAGI